MCTEEVAFFDALQTIIYCNCKEGLFLGSDSIQLTKIWGTHSNGRIPLRCPHHNGFLLPQKIAILTEFQQALGSFIR